MSFTDFIQGLVVGRPSPKAATVSGTVTGPIYTVSPYLGSSATLSLVTGTNSNLTISGTSISAGTALGSASQVGLVREVLGQIAVEYPVTLTGAGAPSTGTLDFSQAGNPIIADL